MSIQNGQINSQNRVFEAVAIGKSLQEILRLTTELIEKELPGSFASVLLSNETETRLFSGSAESLSADYNHAINGIQIGEAIGSCGTAAFRREMVVVSDILNDPLWEGFRKLAQEHNLRACWSQPIFAPEGKLYGTFAIYFSAPRKPEAHELLLLESTARIAGIAIEHKYIEEKLRETSSRLENTLTASEVGTWTWDSVSDRVFADKNLAQMFSVSNDAANGGAIENYLLAIHPEDRERVGGKIQLAMENEDRYETNYRLVQADSSIRWVIARGRVERDETNKAVGLSGVIIDITATKAAEEALSKTEERYRTLFNSIDEGFCIAEVLFDDDGRGIDHRFLEMNPSFEELTGVSADIALSGKTVREIIPEIENKWNEIYGQVVLTGEPIRAVEKSEALNRWFDIYVSRIGQANERKVAIIFTNITDRILAEQEREKLLASEQIARAEAENSNRLKDEFLATLSHELRTPLNAILGWTQILLKGRLDETQRHSALVTIERSARSQNQLIEDILDVSRIITGNMRLDVQAVNLLNVISSAIESAQPGADAKNIKIQTLLDPEAATISGDSNRLQQVVWNLLSNAIKFTPKNGRVQIRLERINSSVVTTVSDTGKGIEPEFLPFVFDRFRQSDGSTTRRQGGLGLGLAIVRQLVELHGGTVDVNSQGAGQGSSFTMSLPVSAVRQEPENETLRIHPTATGDEVAINDIDPEELRGLRILVVDDEMDSREMLKVLLNASNAEVETAGSAKEALETIKRGKFDIIVSDIGMPEEDGFSLIEKIRRLTADKGGKTPAIALTAYARPEDRIKVLRSGFQMHIVKPVDHSELIAVIVALSGRANSN